MAKKISCASSKSATTPRPSFPGQQKAVLDVTVVVQQGGYPSAAIAPLEVFHSAGVLWHSLRGESEQPRFRVRTASIDGGGVTTLCSLGLTPEFAITDIKHTDVIIVAPSGQDVMDGIARRCCPGYGSGIHAARTSPASAAASDSSRKPGSSTDDKQPRTGPWPTRFGSAFRKCAGRPSDS
jgi:hypothetical protein